MRSWDKYCEDTRKALEHFRYCINQPVYIVGYITDRGKYLNQSNFLLHNYFGSFLTVEIPPSKGMTWQINNRINNNILIALRGMQVDTVQAFTEMRDIKGYTFKYSTRYTGILNAYGMHKPINRLGNAFSWPHVNYRNIIPLE